MQQQHNNNNNSSLQLKVAKTKSKTSTAKTTHLVAHRVQRCQTCDCVFTYANFVWGKWSRIISKHNKINCVLIRETHKKLLNQLHKLRLWLMHIWFFYGFKFGARLGRYLLWLLLLLLLTLNLSCHQCVRVFAQCVCIHVHMLILLFLITYLMLVMLCAFKSLSKCNNCTWTHWLVWMNLDATPHPASSLDLVFAPVVVALFIYNYWLFDVNQLLLLFNFPITHNTLLVCSLCELCFPVFVIKLLFVGLVYTMNKFVCANERVNTHNILMCMSMCTLIFIHFPIPQRVFVESSTRRRQLLNDPQGISMNFS